MPVHANSKLFPQGPVSCKLRTMLWDLSKASLMVSTFLRAGWLTKMGYPTACNERNYHQVAADTE